MIDVGLFMLVIWIIKNAAEDTLTTVRGQSNPRIERRRQRQKSRANNPIWTQLVGWAGDIAEDARQDAAQSRRRKRENRQRELELAEQREQELAEAEQRDRELAEAAPAAVIDDRGHPGYNQDPADPSVVDMGTPSPREPVDIALVSFWDLGPRDCTVCGEPGAMVQRPDGRTFTHDRTGDRCPAMEPNLDDLKEEEQEQQPERIGSPSTSPDGDPLPDNVIPFARPEKLNPKEYRMSTQVNGEVTGLDPAISYAKSLAMFAGEHGQAGNEGYIGFLQQSKVEGTALASAHEMQEAFANAQAAAEKHEQELAKQKSVQEAYNANPDAGDKQFQSNGQ